MFSNRALAQLILPLIIEQILSITIGLADTLMVSALGETAVSGVALVDTINVLIVNLFAALATGGAIISAQYIGRREQEHACEAAKQLIHSIFLISVAAMLGCVFGGEWILRSIYGNTDPAVMQNAVDYFTISAFSYPFIAVYSAAGAIFRSMGNARISMFAALIMNVCNIGGNALLIFGLGMGVRGAAIASLVARGISGAALLFLLSKQELPVNIHGLLKTPLKPSVINAIMRVGIPTGLENSMFQVGKILVQGIITTFGTAAIAANAVANSVSMFECIPGMAIGMATVTVVGQCIGARDYDAAAHYTKKLQGFTYLSMAVCNVLLLAFSRQIVGWFALSPGAAELANTLIWMHGSFAILIYAPSFGLPNALRAAGDVKFTMGISILSMWLCRILLSYLFANTFGWGVIGVWWAMIADWFLRAALFLMRWASGRWKTKSVL